MKDIKNQLAEANKEIGRWKVEAAAAIAHAEDFRADLQRLTEQHAKAVNCLKSIAAFHISSLDEPGSAYEARECLKELGAFSSPEGVEDSEGVKDEPDTHECCPNPEE